MVGEVGMSKYKEIVQKEKIKMDEYIDRNIGKKISEAIRRGDNYFTINDRNVDYRADFVKKCSTIKDFTHYCITEGSNDRFYFRNKQESLEEIKLDKEERRKRNISDERFFAFMCLMSAGIVCGGVYGFYKLWVLLG